MNLNRIKHTLKRMSTEEKVIGLGALTLFVGSFMPWQEVTRNLSQETTINNAYSGHIGVIGFVTALMTLMAIFYLLAEHVSVRLPQFGYKKSQILFFLMGQSFFLCLLTLTIYTRYSMEFVDAGLRFGMYVSLVGAFLGAFAAFAKVQKVKTNQAKQFFHQEEESDEFEETEPLAEEVQKPQPMYFGEDKTGPVISPAFQASKPEVHPHSAQSQPEVKEEQSEAHHPRTDQGSFFARQAGIK